MCNFSHGFEARGEARGIAIGEARGEARGRAIGEAKDMVKGALKMLVELVKSNDLSIQTASQRAGMTEQQFAALMAGEA